MCRNIMQPRHKNCATMLACNINRVFADILPRVILLWQLKAFKYYRKYYNYYFFYFWFNINSYRVKSKFNRSSRGQSRFLGSMPYWTPRAFLSVNSTVPLISSIFKKMVKITNTIFKHKYLISQQLDIPLVIQTNAYRR